MGAYVRVSRLTEFRNGGGLFLLRVTLFFPSHDRARGIDKPLFAVSMWTDFCRGLWSWGGFFLLCLLARLGWLTMRGDGRRKRRGWGLIARQPAVDITDAMHFTFKPARMTACVMWVCT